MQLERMEMEMARALAEIECGACGNLGSAAKF